MKKAGLLLTTISALLLSACSLDVPADTEKKVDDDEIIEPDIDDDDTGGDKPAETDKTGRKKVKIMFHVDGKTAEGVQYKKRVDAFNEAYSDKYVAIPTFKARSEGGTDYEMQLIADQLDGNLADIITFDAPNCAAYADKGILYNLTDAFTQAEKDDFLSLNTYAGRLFGLPIQESSAGFFYNKNLFKDAGIDVSGYTVENPWTFAQFKEVCGKLKAKGFTAVDMRLDATRDETATYLLYPLIYAAGGSFVSSNGYNAKGYYDSDATKKGFQFIKDLLNEGYTSTKIGASDFFSPTQSGITKVGMYLSSGWTIPELDNQHKTDFPNRDSWGLLPYPMDVTRASATGSWSYGITKNGIGDKEPAIALLKWMSSAESSTAVTNATGMIPSRKSCNPSYPAGSPEKVLLDQLAQTGKERPVTVGYPTFTSTFRDIIAKLESKEVGPIVDAAANELQAALNEKLDDKD